MSSPSHPTGLGPIGLALGVPPSKGLNRGPRQPILFPGGFELPFAYPKLIDLARAIQRRRLAGGVARSLQLVPTLATWDASDSFPAFEVHFGEDGGEPRHAFTVAAPGRPIEALLAAIAEANPDVPEEQAA